MTPTFDWENSRDYILTNLEKISLAEMADKLGVTRQRIHQKIQSWGLEKPYPQRKNFKKLEGVFKIADATSSFNIKGVVLLDIDTNEFKFYGQRI